jgi:TRAP transporter 4TM/12TM fusion protein
MARAGFGPRLAGAIEAIASTGGQLMPPILGADAFLMAEFLELPYRDIALAAVLPALFFYCVLFLAVDLESRRFESSPLALLEVRERLEVSRSEKIGLKWFYLLPVFYLLYLLFWEKRTAEMAGVMSSAAVLLVFLAVPGVRFRERLLKGFQATLKSMDGVAEIVMLSAAAGLVIGVLNITGISFAITMQIFALSGGSLILLLLLCALLSLLLGMGLPTVGVYILLATLVAPAMTQLGVPPLAAHFFVMYFGMLSMITPPVAIASFAAASISGHSPWSTSMTTLRMGMGLYLIPFLFVLNPVLLTWDSPAQMISPVIMSFVTIFAATFALGGQKCSLLNRLVWGLVAAVAFLSAVPNFLPFSLDWFVGILAVVLFARAFYTSKKASPCEAT